MKTHLLEGRKREEWVGDLQNMAHHMANKNSLAGEEEERGAQS
jgi:hypothetical protein